MGVKLGPERLKRAAQLLGIGCLRHAFRSAAWSQATGDLERQHGRRETCAGAARGDDRHGQASDEIRSRADGIRPGLCRSDDAVADGAGGGAIGNLEGKLMKPKIEYNVRRSRSIR